MDNSYANNIIRVLLGKINWIRRFQGITWGEQNRCQIAMFSEMFDKRSWPLNRRRSNASLPQQFCRPTREDSIEWEEPTWLCIFIHLTKAFFVFTSKSKNVHLVYFCVWSIFMIMNKMNTWLPVYGKFILHTCDNDNWFLID